VLIGAPIATYRIDQERKAAKAEALSARQSQYASEMNGAHQAVQDGDLFRAVQLLERHRPRFVVPPSGGSSALENGRMRNRLKAGLQTDLRGWEWRYLWKQCEGDPHYLVGSHTNEVTAVGLLPDRTTAFSASKDHTVKLWDLPSRKLLTELPHDEPVWGAAVSPDGRWFVSLTLNLDYGHGAKPVRLWDLPSRRQIAVLFTNVWPRPGASLAISPDSRLLAFIDQEDPERLVVCELPSGREIVRFPAQTDLVGAQGVAFAPDGQTLAYSANLQGDIALIDTQQWKEVGRLSGHTRNVNCLAVSPDNRFLASIGNDRSLRLWDLRDRRQQAVRERLSDTSWTLAFSPDSTRLAVGIKSSISVFSVPEFAPVTELRWLSKGTKAVKFLSNRELLAGGGDGSVKMFDLDSQRRSPDRTRIPPGLAQLGTTTGPALCLSPDGTHLLAVFTNNTFMLWHTLTMAQSGPFPLPLPSFSCAAISPGGEIAAFADHEGNTVLWRSTNGTTTEFGRPETNGFTRMVFSQDGRRLAFATWIRITAWEVATRKQLQAFPKTDVATMKLVFSPDGETLAACEFTGDVLFSRLNQPGHALTLRGHLIQAGSPAFTRDGNTLITPRGDLRFWDLRTGTQTNRVEGLAGEARLCAISPDGWRLAVGMDNGTISIFDLVSMQEVALFRAFDSGVTHLAFTPDGNTLIATTTEEIRAWRAASLAECDQPTSLNTTKGSNP
jgi:WD40 repeat protein